MPPGPSAGGGRMNWMNQPVDLGLVISQETSSSGAFNVGLLIVL